MGKDFGARVVYHFALYHEDRVSALVTMGLPFLPTGPGVSLDLIPKGFYVMRWRASLIFFIFWKIYDLKKVI